MRTRQSYLISYRAHFHGDGFAEMVAVVDWDTELSEIELHQLVLDNLPGHPEMPEGLHPDDLVITRFHYVSCPPLDVPDIEQDGQGAAPADNPAPDQPGQV